MFKALPDFRQNYSWYLGVLVLLTFSLLGLPYAVRVWRDVKEGPEDESVEIDDVIGPLTDAFAAGEISKEEYERIKNSVQKSGRE